MANDLKPKYGSKQSITITLASLANGSARQSTVISNVSDLWEDALVQIKALTGGTATGPLNVYVYASSDGGTTYPDGVTGSDGAYTMYTNPGIIWLGATGYSGSGAITLVMTPRSIARAYGGKMPQYWGIIVVNNTGTTLNATGSNHDAFYQGQMHQIV